MALQFDNRLYSGGAVNLDSRPHTQLYINLLQRKAAQEEAFDEYLRNLNKSVNSAGLRNVDRPAFEKKLSDWQQFNMQNRDAIRNPRTDKGNAALQSQVGYQDLMNMVAESKQEEEKKKPIIEARLDPNKWDRMNHEELINAISLHDLPLYNDDGTRNEKRKSFDPMILSYSPKPFEQDKFFKSFDDVKRTDLPPTVVKNPKDMTQTVTTTSVFDPEAKDLIATRAVAEYMNNKSFKEFVDKLNPWEYNDFYKQNFGHDIHSAADLAAAYTLKGMQQKVVKSELKDDVFARQKAMEAIRKANDEDLIRFRQQFVGSDKELNNLWIDKFWENKLSNAVPNSQGLKDEKGNFTSTKDIRLDPVLEKALVVNGNTADYIKQLPNGDIVYGLYQRDKDGNVLLDNDKREKIDKSAKRVTDAEGIKAALGKQAGVKQLNKEMSAGTKAPTYLIKGKTYSHEQLIKMGYTSDQIAPYKQ